MGYASRGAFCSKEVHVMGADMMLAYCEVSVSKEVAIQRIGAMTDSMLLGWANEWDFEQEFDETALDEDEMLEIPQNTLANDLTATLLGDIETVFDWGRNIAHACFDDKHYAVTGGMSWGDVPTESYLSVQRLGQLGVCGEIWETAHTYLTA